MALRICRGRLKSLKQPDLFRRPEKQQPVSSAMIPLSKRVQILVFLDPPFAWQDWENLFTSLKNSLKNGAMVYIEAGELPDFPEWLEPYREGRAGKSSFVLLQFVQVAE